VLKLTIIFLVLVWAGSGLLGSKKRLIRDVDHLIQYLVWAVLLFLGFSMIGQTGLADRPVWVKGGALAVWAAVSFLGVLGGRRWMVRAQGKKRTKKQ
jgi:predicted tellurium resistance membrane protein TerC